jgi:transmembrane sensor
MTDPISSDLLARYLGGEATPAERDAVERWAGLDPQNAAELRRLAAVWSPKPEGNWDVDRAWNRVIARLDESDVVPIHSRRRVLALAAAVILTLGATFVWRAQNRDVEFAQQVYVTNPGERREVNLPDSTRIIVAPGSSLTVAKGYGQSDRTVTLEGEAWFDVRHDASRPFRVHAAGTVTEDLGTEFSVRARAGEAVRVVLVTGRASFARESAARAVELAPGEVAQLGAADVSPVVTRAADVARLVSWREGRLDFVDAPLSEVLAELGRWYALEFRVEDSTLTSRRLTHTFATGDLTDALEVLSLSLGARAERAGSVVTLR